MFKTDPDYIKKIQINWENFAIVRDKKNSCRNKSLLNDIFDLSLTFLFNLVSKVFSTVLFCYIR